VSNSLQVNGPWNAATGASSFLSGAGVYSISFFFEALSTFPAGINGILGHPLPSVPFFANYNEIGGEADTFQFSAGPGGVLSALSTFVPGTIQHCAISYNGAGTSYIWVNDGQVASLVSGGTPNPNTSPFGIGWMLSTLASFRIANLAMWGSYALSQADALVLRNQSASPLSIGTGTIGWWTLSGTPGATPAGSDAGFQDQGTSGLNFSTITGTPTNAIYAGPLIYVPPTTVTPYVSKCGKLAYFFTQATGTSSNQPVTAVNQTPEIQVQFGGEGSPATVQTQTGYLWNNGNLPFATWNLVCGGVQEAVVQVPGSGYVSPSASLSGGSPTTPATLGTPVLTGGVTSYTVTSGGSGYASAPLVTVAGNGFSAIGQATIADGAVTGITAWWPGRAYTGSVTVTLTGGGGSGATATGTISNVIASIPVTSAGAGYLSAPTITVTDGSGAGAIVQPLMSGIAPYDVVTYTGVSDGWINSTVGPAPGVPGPYVSNNGVANYSGQLEPGVGNVTPYVAPSARTMKLGFDVGGGFVNSTPYCMTANWLKRNIYTKGASVNTSSQDGRPLLISGYASNNSTWYTIFDAPANQVDAGGYPTPTGVWTLIADETNAANPMQAEVDSNNGAASHSTVYTPGTSATGCTSLTLTAGGSGYTDTPTVTIAGGGGSGATGYAILANGAVIAVYLTGTGQGYTGAPTVTITPLDGNGSGATATATTGAVIVGSVWQTTIARTEPGQWDLALRVKFWSPAYSSPYPYSLCNEALFDPGETAAALPGLPSRADPLRVNVAMLGWLNPATGGSPAFLRYMDSTADAAPGGGNTNVIEACDLVNPNAWSWGAPRAPLSGAALTANPTGPRTITVNNVRTYSIAGGFPSGWGVSWTSPNIYTNQWGTATPGWTGYGAGLAGPFYLTPANPGFLNSFGASTNQFAAEFTTTAPHNLKLGNIVLAPNFDSANFTISSNGTGGGTLPAKVSAFGIYQVYPTGPSTFVLSLGASEGLTAPGLPGGINQVIGSQAISYPFTLVVPDQIAIPFELSAKISAAARANHWVTIGCAMTDSCVTAIARRIRDIMPKGSQTMVDYSNENWNLSFMGGYFCNSMGALGAWTNGTPVTQVQACVMRAGQIHAIFVNVYNEPDINGNTNRGGEIIPLFGSQMTGVGLTQEVMEAINTVNGSPLPCGAVSVAPYQGIGGSSSSGAGGLTATLACASTESHWPTSLGWKTATPWSRAAYLDYFRHALVYLQGANSYNAASGLLQQHIAFLETYTGGPTPHLVGYEGIVQSLLPGTISTGVDPIGNNLEGQASRDLFYDPAAYDVSMAFYAELQQWGVWLLSQFTLAGPMYGDPQDPAIYTTDTWQQQPAGKGDGSRASNGQNVTNLFWRDTAQCQDVTNASPYLQAWQDWISAEALGFVPGAYSIAGAAAPFGTDVVFAAPGAYGLFGAAATLVFAGPTGGVPQTVDPDLATLIVAPRGTGLAVLDCTSATLVCPTATEGLAMADFNSASLL
jgi:hypothetical protein